MPDRERGSLKKKRRKCETSKALIFSVFFSSSLFSFSANRASERASESEAKQSLSSPSLSLLLSASISMAAQQRTLCESNLRLGEWWSTRVPPLERGRKKKEGDDLGRFFFRRLPSKTTTVIVSLKLTPSRFHNQSIRSKRARREARVWIIAGESKRLSSQRSGKRERRNHLVVSFQKKTQCSPFFFLKNRRLQLKLNSPRLPTQTSSSRSTTKTKTAGPEKQQRSSSNTRAAAAGAGEEARRRQQQPRPRRSSRRGPRGRSLRSCRPFLPLPLLRRRPPSFPPLPRRR